MKPVMDGRERWQCSLADYYRQPIIASEAARRGFLIPPVSAVDETATPAQAFVDYLDGTGARWLASCPDCRPFVDIAYVWLEGPHIAFFLACGNAGAGGEWRPVSLPSNWRAIEKTLAVRPPDRRVWWPWETVAKLKQENAGFGWE